MKRTLSAAINASLFIVFLVALLAPSLAAEMPLGKITVKTGSGEYIFTVERAETQTHQARGLMHRRHMKADHGMLFTWPSERNASMWMANTVLPLDMVFIKKDGTVHRVEQNTIPFSETIIEAGTLVVRVLELNAGTAAKIGLKPGDRVRPHWD